MSVTVYSMGDKGPSSICTEPVHVKISFSYCFVSTHLLLPYHEVRGVLTNQ